MAILILRATSAKLSIGTGEFERKPPLLAFGAKLEGRESLKLTTGEETKHVDLVVSVKYDENTQKDDKKVGVAHYFPSRSDEFNGTPATIIFEILIDANRAQEMRSWAISGHIPSDISLEIEGMECDWQPDGSGKKWDNQASRMLPITSARFAFPLVVKPDEDDPDWQEQAATLPPTRTQFFHLQKQINQVESAVTKVFWAVVVVAALFAFAFFRRG